MKTPKILLIHIVLIFGVVLSACTTEPAMVDNTATSEMMESSSDETMPEESMMEETPTPEMMMEETATPDMMMDETPTSDAMMEDKDEDEMMEEGKDDSMMEEESEEGSMMEGEDDDAMMESPAWFSASLTNVQTGESFTIRDFSGKVVLVEAMAQWCPSCKRQQQEVKSLLENMGMPEDLVVVALDIDLNEDAETLKDYAASNGFDWIYAISPAEVSSELGNLYGNQFLNPPSTPILIIDRHGEAHPLPFGIKSADDLMEAIEPFLDDM
jgi:thiol-disulfide isomerase/thioredoxin